MKDLKNIIKTTIREYLNEYKNPFSVISEATASEIKIKYYPDISQDDFNKIVKSDKVTSNIENGKVGKYAKWLLKLYSNDNLDLYELDKVEKYISLFDKLSKSEKLSNRDINSYKSLDDVYNVISDYLDTNKPISKGDEIRKIKSGSKKIYADDKFLVIQPLTKRASCYYGKSTKWCTSGDYKDNKFDEYTSEGPLYVVIDKTKINSIGDYAKYLIHLQRGEYKDDNNEEVYFEGNEELREVVKKIIEVLNISPMDLVDFNSKNIIFIDNPSEEVQLKVVRENPYIIQQIDNPTDKVKQLAIKLQPDLEEYLKNRNTMTSDEIKKEELEHLEDLLQHGYITQREFDTMSRRFLN